VAATPDGGAAVVPDGGGESFTVSVNIVGLRGTGLVLRDKSGAELAVAPTGGATQTAVFPAKFPKGSGYEVTVKTQPSSPRQLCAVAAGTGTIVSGDVASITVNCTDQFTVGGTVQGLAGKNLVLQNNEGADLTINANGTFAFAATQVDGTPFAVTTKQNPTSPWQTCVVSNGAGKIAGADVSSIGVACTTNKYKVGVSVSGLEGTGLVLQNNAKDDLAVTANGKALFAESAASGEIYWVTVKTQPSSPPQTCTVVDPTGTVSSLDAVLTTVCETAKFKVGGVVKNMVGKGLVLQNNGADDLTLDANGAFTFKAGVKHTSPYAVTIKTQPNTPAQVCSVLAGTGTINAAEITNVVVDCAPESCKSIKDASPASASGVYTLNPKGAGGPITTYCDMTTDGGGWTLLVNRGTISDDLGQPDLAQTLGTFADTRATNWQFDVSRFYAAASHFVFASKHNSVCAGCSISGYDSALKVAKPAGALTKACSSTIAASVVKLVGPSAGTMGTGYWCDGALGWGNCSGSVCHYGVHGQNTSNDGSWSGNTFQELHFPSAYSNYRSYNSGSKYCRSCSGGLQGNLNNSSTCCNGSPNDDKSTWTIWVR